jgi:hypothetical protein
LEKVTPGPWHTNHGYAYTDGLRVFGNDGADIVAAQLYAEEADFIVHAPDDIRYLLSYLDREREENRKLREERDKLIEGLRWYSNQELWTKYPWSQLLRDGGKRARNTLKEIGVTVE